MYGELTIYGEAQFCLGLLEIFLDFDKPLHYKSIYSYKLTGWVTLNSYRNGIRWWVKGGPIRLEEILEEKQISKFQCFVALTTNNCTCYQYQLSSRYSSITKDHRCMSGYSGTCDVASLAIIFIPSHMIICKFKLILIWKHDDFLPIRHRCIVKHINPTFT